MQVNGGHIAEQARRDRTLFPDIVKNAGCVVLGQMAHGVFPAQVLVACLSLSLRCR